VLALLPKIPDAVYFCSIEPPSISYQSALEVALRQIQREDPSLRVRYDEKTAQTVLGGMGELHLEIIKSRLLTEYKIDADLGPLQIAYRETLLQPARGQFSAQKEIAGSKQSITIEMSLEPRRQDKDLFRLDNSPEASEVLKPIRPRLIQLVRKGALAAMERGPKLGGEVMDVGVVLHSLAIGRGTADSFIMSGAAQCVQKILLDANCSLLEPIMCLEIVVPSDRAPQILGDLSRRRATIVDVSARGDQSKVILVDAPLAELSGYSSVVRTLSSGTASMSMQPNGYAAMSMHDEVAAIRRAQGLE
jgi:elongation factor G